MFGLYSNFWWKVAFHLCWRTKPWKSWWEGQCLRWGLVYWWVSFLGDKLASTVSSEDSKQQILYVLFSLPLLFSLSLSLSVYVPGKNQTMSCLTLQVDSPGYLLELRVRRGLKVLYFSTWIFICVNLLFSVQHLYHPSAMSTPTVRS